MSPDNQLLAIGGGDGVTRVYEVGTWKLLRWLPGHGTGVTALGWSHDGEWLASGDREDRAPTYPGTLRFWKRDGTPGPVHSIKGGVSALDWHPSENLLVAGGMAQLLLCGPENDMPQLFRRVGSDSVSWCPDGQRFVASDKTDVQMWGRDGSKGPRLSHETRVRLATCSSQGVIAAVEREELEGVLRFWSQDGTPGAVVKLNPAPSRIEWNAQGTQLAILQFNMGHLRVFDTTGMELHGGPLATSGDPPLSIAWHGAEMVVSNAIGIQHYRLTRSITEGTKLDVLSQLSRSRNPHFGLAWHPDGKHFVTANYYWKWGANGESVERLHPTNLLTPRWSPDGKFFTGVYDSNIVWLHTADGKRHVALPKFSAKMDDYRSIAWNAQSDRLAISTHREVTQWNTDGKPGPVLQDQDQQFRLRPVAWSPDGEIVSSGVDPVRLQFWDRDGKPTRTIPLDSDCVALAYSPDGERLAIARSKVLEIRAANDGRLMVSNEDVPGNQKVTGISWSPDSQQLVVRKAWPSETCWIFDTVTQTFRALPGHTAHWSSSGQIAAFSPPRTIVWDGATGDIQWVGTLFDFTDGDSGYVTLSGAGEVITSKGDIEIELVYLHEQPDGRIDVLKPSEFRQRLEAWQKANRRRTE